MLGWNTEKGRGAVGHSSCDRIRINISSHDFTLKRWTRARRKKRATLVVPTLWTSSIYRHWTSASGQHAGVGKGSAGHAILVAPTSGIVMESFW